MIVIRVELHSAITKQVTEIARMYIINRGDGTNSSRNYDVEALRGRSTEAFNKRKVQRKCEITGWNAPKLHVWNLVRLALDRMGYTVTE